VDHDALLKSEVGNVWYREFMEKEISRLQRERGY